MLSGHEGLPPGMEAVTGEPVYWDHDRSLDVYANSDRSKPLWRIIDIKVPMRISLWPVRAR